MDEETFYNKFKSLERDIFWFETIEEVDDDCEESWIIVDGELFSRKWEE